MTMGYTRFMEIDRLSFPSPMVNSGCIKGGELGPLQCLLLTEQLRYTGARAIISRQGNQICVVAAIVVKGSITVGSVRIA